MDVDEVECGPGMDPVEAEVAPHRLAGFGRMASSGAARVQPGQDAQAPEPPADKPSVARSGWPVQGLREGDFRDEGHGVLRIARNPCPGAFGQCAERPYCRGFKAAAGCCRVVSGLSPAEFPSHNRPMNDTGRLLVVDDDPSVRMMLVEYLSGHRFDVQAVDSGSAMRTEIERNLPDLILLDIRLPGEDGITLARFLRERYDVGIIMVTASGDVVDRVVGLEVGADDYIAKPFEPRELLARVRSVLRRMQAKQQMAAAAEAAPTVGTRQRVGRCEIDLESRLLFEGSEEVPMTAMEFELLRVFLANPNRVLSRDQLLMRTRNREWEPFDRSIDIRIGRLRRKIEPDPSGEPRCIRTVRNGGYMYVP
jgi:DNA-binding response OmpR family regulator